MSEKIVEVVVGDICMFQVTLTDINGNIVPIPDSSIVKAAVITHDHSKKLTEDITQSKDNVGADWSQGLIVGIMLKTETIIENYIGFGWIELQVEVNGNPSTYFGLANIVPGLID